MTDNERLPKWAKWQQVTDVKTWEGIALSLNIEPSKVRHDRDAFGEHQFRESERFHERLFIFRRNKDARQLPGPGTGNGERFIDLREFARWASAIWRDDIPRQLAEMAAPIDTFAATIIPDAPINAPFPGRVYKTNPRDGKIMGYLTQLRQERADQWIESQPIGTLIGKFIIPILSKGQTPISLPGRTTLTGIVDRWFETQGLTRKKRRGGRS